MNFKDFLAESERRNTMEKISEKGYQIYLHLIKLLYYIDPINIDHHLSDIDGWIREIASIIGKQKFTHDVLIELLMGHYKFDKSRGVRTLVPYDPLYLINNKFEDYNSLSVARDIDELNKILLTIYNYICKKLSCHQDAQIQKYVKQFIITEK